VEQCCNNNILAADFSSAQTKRVLFISARSFVLEMETNNDLAWFCLQSQQKHEHIAAAHLRQEGIEVFLPRIRLKRKTARGPVWVTEVLFPAYLFARFNWRESLRMVRHAPGVSRVVSFGRQMPTIPDRVIAELREQVGDKELHVIPDVVQPGEEIQIAGGAFHGLRAVVQQVFPAKQRVQVLLDFLGRQTSVELSSESVVPETAARKRLG
jgi:transcriptional antiterminator RfaH